MTMSNPAEKEKVVMIRKTMIGALMLVALGSTAWAQTPKVEFTGLIGYSLADGVSGDPYKAGNGQTYALHVVLYVVVLYLIMGVL
jgi:hypothetical protein